MEELGDRQRPVAGRLPAVDEGDAGPGRAAAGRDEPGRQASRRPATARRRPRTAGPRSAGVDLRRPRRGKPARTPVDEREAIGERERGGGDRGERCRPGGVGGTGQVDGTPAGLSSVAVAASKPIWPRRYTQPVAKREPHVVLGIEPGATPDPDQGRLAEARAAASPRPHRRRPRGVAGRDARRWPRSTRPTRRSRATAARPRPGGAADGAAAGARTTCDGGTAHRVDAAARRGRGRPGR